MAIITTGPPGAIPVTTPLVETVAMAGFPEVQATERPFRMLLAASLSVALSCVVAPTIIDPLLGVTATVATGTGVTVIVASPATPSLVARITADPGYRAVTSPVAETLATASAEELHATALPPSGLPCASLGVADSWVVEPTIRFCAPGVTETDATRAGGGVLGAAVPPPQAAAITSGVTPQTKRRRCLNWVPSARGRRARSAVRASITRFSSRCEFRIAGYVLKILKN